MANMATTFKRSGTSKVYIKWKCKGCRNHPRGGWHSDPSPAASEEEALALGIQWEMVGSREKSGFIGDREFSEHGESFTRHREFRDTRRSAATAADRRPQPGQKWHAPNPSNSGCCRAAMLSVDQLCSLFLLQHNGGARPKEAAGRIRKHVSADEIGALVVVEMRPADVSAWLQRRSSSAPRSLVHLRTLLGSVLTWALGEGLLCSTHNNVVLQTRKPKTDQRSFGWLRAEEVKLVLAATEERWRPLLALGCYAGLRKGEILSLRRKDIDLTERLIHVQASNGRAADKAGKHRMVPIGPDLFAVLEPILRNEGSPEDVVFQSRCRRVTGKGSKRRVRMQRHVDLCAVLRRAVATAGLQHRLPMRFHDTRHSCASVLLNRGVPMKLLSVMLGHSSVSVTEKIYAHLDPHGSLQQLKEAIG